MAPDWLWLTMGGALTLLIAAALAIWAAREFRAEWPQNLGIAADPEVPPAAGAPPSSSHAGRGEDKDSSAGAPLP